MTIKRWVFSALVYLTVVIASYGFITGSNPFESKNLHEEEHGDGEQHTE
ncbi:hypothetical protein [Shouchella patagoniensis]|nr:hypothetical protein [Shouchella patagoniensis]